jgi:tetratricopeptide (TPR) repeat protein
MKLTKMLFALTVIGVESMAHAAACDPYTRQDPGGDYTNADDRQGLAIVEKFHFTPSIERLIPGESALLGGDIDYTLRHFPNHHRALAAMAKLGLRDKTAKPSGTTYSIVCYFDRAIGFKPNDAKVRMIYGSYLMAIQQFDQAMEQLQEAARLSPDNPAINYNLGLMYLKKNDYAQARVYAQKAYDLGFPLPGLKDKLRAAGQWDNREKNKPAAQAVPQNANDGTVAPEATPSDAAEVPPR